MTGSRARRATAPPLVVAGESVAPGSTRQIDLPVARLPTHTPMDLPLVVRRGLHPGPCVWLSACVHGDELNGVEIIRRVLEATEQHELRGALIAAPVVNVFGFIHQSRYLPDRRDLNRSFPGSARGSLASRLAHLFMTEVVARCTHGIDLHTGSNERHNLPQIRADLDDPETLRCARAFGAPVMMNAKLRDGSLRAAATRRGLPVLLFEGGEAYRFDTTAVEAGTAGVLRVLAALGMLEAAAAPPAAAPGRLLARSSWVRARHAGLARLDVELGAQVRRNDLLGVLADPFGTTLGRLTAPHDGVVIGLLRNPVVHRGDAVVHVGLPA